MARPRIRTLKPEFFQDEGVSDLSRDARLLLIGLITMADDEGRLRAGKLQVLAHVFPHDVDAPRRYEAWLAEIVSQDMVFPFEHGGKPYLAFRHWRRHQKPNRATPSVLPPPPDSVIVADNVLPGKDERPQ